MILNQRNTPIPDRRDAFAKYAKLCCEHEVVIPPLNLQKEQRRLYIRQTLREDHHHRIKHRPEGAQSKFDKLTRSAFIFFRGTSLVFYRDHAGMDSHLPIVFTIGDLHPENFGVMPNEDDAPIFAVNDFDEAYFAPFTYDVKRGAVGFYLAGQENGFKKKAIKKVIKAFSNGYIKGLKEFALDDRERWHQFRLDNSPDIIRDLIQDSLEKREKFISKKIDLESQKFLASKKVVPASSLVKEFQAVVDQYVKENGIKASKKSFFKVLDVAQKVGSGTASLGLDRYWVLIQGEDEEAGSRVILEFKQARRSALSGLVPEHDGNDAERGGAAKHIVSAHDTHLAGGDRFYGHASYEDVPFLVRERSRYKNDYDHDDLDEESMEAYAKVCGKSLAQTHARSDEDTDTQEGNAEEKILSCIQPKVFIDDTYRFAKQAAKRVRKDWKLFKKDHRLGAFDINKPE